MFCGFSCRDPYLLSGGIDFLNLRVLGGHFSNFSDGYVGPALLPFLFWIGNDPEYWLMARPQIGIFLLV
jgi:hypothetical protein